MGDSEIDWEAELSTYRRTASTKGGAGSDDDRDEPVKGRAPAPSSVSARAAPGSAATAPPSRPPPTPPSKAAGAPASPPPVLTSLSTGGGPARSPPSTPLPALVSPTARDSSTTPATPRSAASATAPPPRPLLVSTSSVGSAAAKKPAVTPVASTPKGGDDDSDDDEKDTSRASSTLDDEDEKDEPSPWIEFKDEKGVKLWFNPRTQATSIGAFPPVGGSVAGASSRNLLKSTGAVGEGDEDEDDEDDDDKPRARRGEAMVDEVEGAGESKSSKRGKKDVMTPDKILTSLRLIEKQIDLILEQSHTLAPPVCDDLRAIRKHVESCQKQLETVDTVDNRGDVDALIEWNKLPWNFDNKHVKGYRAQAATRTHLEYKEWHMPQSFSDWPLPPDSKTVTAAVRLPPSADAKAVTSTRINISDNDAVNKLVQQCFNKTKGLPGEPSDYCLKASGLADYMDGDRKMFSYEYVRSCIRDNIEVKLLLVRRPSPVAETKEAKGEDSAAQYLAKVDRDIEPMTLETHRNIVTSRDKWEDIKSIALSEVALPFRIRIIGMDKVNGNTLPLLDGTFSNMWLKVFLFHGQQYVTDSIKTTAPLPVCESPRWMTWLMGDYNKETLLNQLPRAVRVGFILFGRREAEKDKEVMLGWAVHQLIDQWGRLSSGAMDIRLWPIEGKKKKGHGKKRDLDPDFIFRQTNRDNNTPGEAAVLRVKFDEFAVPVVAPLKDSAPESTPRDQKETPFKSLHSSQQKRIEWLVASDLLSELTADDKVLIWTMRHLLSKTSSMLPKFLLCVNWGRPDLRTEALRLLAAWAPPVSPIQALELLDAKYADYSVREYAITWLRRMKDDELRLYLLQITQCLKFEPYHDSPLAAFLIERALRSPYEIGHHFFWHLKAELHAAQFSERFAVILEEYLSFAGRFAKELRKQNQAVLKLERIAAMIVRLKREHGYSDEDAMREYKKEVNKLNTDFFGPQGKFQIPLNPKLEATSLIVEKCRYMSSKMVPLWLVFKNADEDAPPIYIIFKSGDDLRQDILTLQILRVMDKMWLEAGYDMRMKPYRVIATGVNDHGEGVGMIEVVLNSDTTSGIQLQYGGGAMGALKMDPIDLFLREHNRGAVYEKAVQNFIMSCAGYCVATFVLGIGDRHNGNIMVTKDGHLFHIDFGHFLGNFKKKFGVNRERAAFVFTPEMAYVMGGKKYQKSPLFKKFLELCSNSFKTLRVNATILENLFVLMVSAGMPELMKEQDIHYMRDKMYLDVSHEKKADKKLQAEINKSLDSTYRRIDNMIHNLKHG